MTRDRNGTNQIEQVTRTLHDTRKTGTSKWKRRIQLNAGASQKGSYGVRRLLRRISNHL